MLGSLLASALLATSLAAAPSAPSAPSAPELPRATWVWHRTNIADLLALAEREGVADLFVSVPGDLAHSPDLPWFERLRTRSLAAGISMHALAGEKPWLEDNAAGLAWQEQALATGLFDGVHLDIEPWGRTSWREKHDVLLQRLVRLLTAMEGATDLPVEADISFWLDDYAVDGVPADRAVMAAVDGVTVMSYRDTVTGPDSITGVGEAALASAEATGTPIRLAIETHQLGNGAVADKQSWWGESRARVRRALARVDATVLSQAGNAPYQGVAVHDAEGWAALKKR